MAWRGAGLLPAARRPSRLDFPHTAPIQNYVRSLELSDAVCRVSYTCEGVTFQREIFASHPDDVIVLRLTASQPGRLTFRVRLDSPHPVRTMALEDERLLVIKGQAPGFTLRRDLEWVEKKGDTHKYPAVWDENGRRRKAPTRCHDKAEALRYANHLENQARKRRTGEIDVKAERYGKEARRPLSEHLADFRGGCLRLDRTQVAAAPSRRLRRRLRKRTRRIC